MHEHLKPDTWNPTPYSQEFRANNHRTKGATPTWRKQRDETNSEGFEQDQTEVSESLVKISIYSAASCKEKRVTGFGFIRDTRHGIGARFDSRLGIRDVRSRTAPCVLRIPYFISCFLRPVPRIADLLQPHLVSRVPYRVPVSAFDIGISDFYSYLSLFGFWGS